MPSFQERVRTNPCEPPEFHYWLYTRVVKHTARCLHSACDRTPLNKIMVIKKKKLLKKFLQVFLTIFTDEKNIHYLLLDRVESRYNVPSTLFTPLERTNLKICHFFV